MKRRNLSWGNAFFPAPGFTLLEVVVATAVSAALFLIVVPAVVNGLSSYALYGTARQVATDIRGWQQQAMMDPGSAYSVLFNPSGEAYYLVKGAVAGEKRSMPVYLDLVTTNFNEHKLSLKPNGNPVSGGTITLREKLTGKNYYIIVAPVTGRVRVSPLPPED